MKKRILLIDDDVIGANLLSQLLNYMGYEVCSLPRIERVFYEIPKCKPDLILLHDILSTISSNVIERSINAIDGSSHIPVVKFSESDYSGFTSLLASQENVKHITSLDTFIQKIEHQLVA
ncbi:response regulator [Mucilaginibacter robiniae]|uniref:Response regulator n=1 Tax=Mucilaginibacter robiniae TaxID=2728022 RepID=A0A7L5DW92_9SPHI|nr:response regulator [Mucilaginibacter robiniae]QJD94508.1 response regulator [Mucilaginibacter robiniae]